MCASTSYLSVEVDDLSLAALELEGDLGGHAQGVGDLSLAYVV